jgi:hydrophobic/amphiphilic exporter-1 (mainly G- bacteria), HAE1 family
MNLSARVIGRPVTVTMLTLGVLVFGYLSYERLEVNLMPDISYPSITVRTEYEGAAPEEVEDLVSIPVEEALAAVRNLTQISSVSRAGGSDVLLELGWDADLDQAILDIRQKLDMIELPKDASRPRILRYNPALEPIMKYGLYAESEVDLYRLRRLAEDEMKQQLERIPGVAAAKIQGGLEEEVLIEVAEDALVRFGISMELIQRRLAQENINLAGGVLAHGEAEYILRTTNELETLPEMGEIVLARRGSADIRLHDVARVRSAPKDRKVITRIGGLESVEIAIYKEADANTVAISRSLQRAIGERTPETHKSAEAEPTATPEGGRGAAGRPKGPQTLSEQLPEGVYIKLLQDQARFIQRSIDEVLSSALFGGLLAVLVLYLFLQELLATAIIALAIPISVVATFSLMYFNGVSINIMSLGGLALGIGMLVDNAIVVLESIFRCREEGDDPVTAAGRGAGEVGTAVVASTLTTVAVFFPIAFVQGIAGQLFVDQALTVTFSLLASLVMSLTLVPMLAALRAPQLGGRGSGLWLTRLLGGAAQRARRRAPVRPVLVRSVALGALYLPCLAAEGTARLAGFLCAEVPWVGVPAGRYRLGREAGEGRLSAFVRLLYRAPAHLALSVGTTLGRAPGWIPQSRPLAAAWRLLAFVPLALLRLLGLVFLQVALLLRLALLAGARVLETLAVALLAIAAGALYVLLRLFRALIWLPQKLFQRLYGTLAAAYPPALRTVLANGGSVVLLAVGLLGASAMLWSRLGTELVPRLHQGELSVAVKRPVGTTLAETDRAIERVERLARELPGFRTAYATVGVSLEGSMVEARERENEGVVTFQLDPDAALEAGGGVRLRPGRDMAALEGAAVARLREHLALLPGVTTQLSFPSLFSFKTPVEVEIRGHELHTLRAYADALVEHLRQVEGLHDLRSNLEEGYPEVQIRFDRERMASLGLDLRTVAQLVRDKVQGAVPTRFSEPQRKLDMRVRLQEADRESLLSLSRLVVNPGGLRPIPLSAVARLEIGQGPSEIKRIDQARVAVLSANVQGVDLGTIAGRLEHEVRRLPAPTGLSVQVSGQSTEMKVSFDSLKLALLLAVFLVYLVMASQFESFVQPLIILFTIPLAAIGVLVALHLMQVPVSIMVFIGMIVLAGIVVNNAIVLIDYINLLRSRGLPVQEAIVQAGSARLRPILMTTGTTVLGLLPMAFGLGEGAEMRMPLALTLIAGLSSSTLLTLFVIPTVYGLISRDAAAPGSVGGHPAP